MPRLYIYFAGLLIVAGLLYGAYHAGQLAERDKVHQAVTDFRDREAKLLDDLEQARAERQIEYRDRIRVIRQAVDPTSCADQKITPAIKESLQ